jgi:GTP-binding protein EngB required for normal cell division
MTADEAGTAGGATGALNRLALIAQEAGAPALAEEARAVSTRVAAGLFYVACVGQFKRGKSTLINALVGRPVLPTGVIPVTAVPTVLLDGDAGARVRLRDEGWREIPLDALAEYVTEEGNPGNTKGVLAAEVCLRAPLLRLGCCLVDTPGLGSAFEANSAAARAFVPQIDAAVVVIGADPPISGEELALVGEVAGSVEELIFVLNKMDRLPEADRREALAFTKRMLRERLGRPAGEVFEVSALAALRGEGDAGAWQPFVHALERLPAQRGRLVASAACRGVARLGGRLQRTLCQQRAALARPIEVSERQARELRDLARDAGRALAELAPLLEAEQMRLRRHFEERRLRFLERAAPEARVELIRRLGALSFGRRIERALALETANAAAREWITPWLGEAEREAESAYRSATGRFAEYGARTLERLGRVAGLDSSTFHLDGEPVEGFRTKRGFYFSDLLYRHDPPRPWRHWADRLLPVRTSRRRVIAAADCYLADLLHVNASRVEGDLNDRVLESRRRLEAEIAALLREASEGAEQALDRARRARSAGEGAVLAAVSAVERRLQAVSELMAISGRAAQEQARWRAPRS